jgi:2-oxoglutarate dehydrogenase E2 component (dihydrolipoamide succinyltransferase)
MDEITIPKLNSTDQTYVLVEWLLPNGDRVSRGDAIARIETSKAIEDLVAGEDGYLLQRVPPGAVCRPGDVVGQVCADAAAAAATASPVPGIDATTEPLLTMPARELVDRHGISLAAVRALGIPLVRRSDVERLMAPGDVNVRPPKVPLPAHQRAVAQAVLRSHTSIPTAFTMVKVMAAEVLRRQRLWGERTRAFIGLPEFVIKAIAARRGSFPRCFAVVNDDLTVEYFAHPHIGVSIDAGRGLFLPVVRHADTVTVADIAATLMDFRVRAQRGMLTGADLSGGAITLTLHTPPGVVLARPIVFPGQTCALSLCGLQDEVYLDGSGVARSRRFVHLGLAYDHRLVNGREAAEFLDAIRADLEASN